MNSNNFNISVRYFDFCVDEAEATIADLSGQVFQHVVRFGDDGIAFLSADGTGFIFHHEQDCCESVDIESITGDLSDLAGEPLLLAEEVTGETAQPAGWMPDSFQESFTWTFYKFATRKGYVDVRWFGSSNGYYSESVDLDRITWSS